MDVLANVVQTVAVRRRRADRLGTVEPARRVVLARAIRLVALREALLLEPPARGELPFGFGRQHLAVQEGLMAVRSVQLVPKAG
jgi:hypothetical protein